MTIKVQDTDAGERGRGKKEGNILLNVEIWNIEEARVLLRAGLGGLYLRLESQSQYAELIIFSVFFQEP